LFHQSPVTFGSSEHVSESHLDLVLGRLRAGLALVAHWASDRRWAGGRWSGWDWSWEGGGGGGGDLPGDQELEGTTPSLASPCKFRIIAGHVGTGTTEHWQRGNAAIRVPGTTIAITKVTSIVPGDGTPPRGWNWISVLAFIFD